MCLKGISGNRDPVSSSFRSNGDSVSSPFFSKQIPSSSYPWDYKCSEYGFHQWNLTALMIEIFAYFGWAYDLKTANSQLVNKMKEGVIKRKQSNQLDPDDVEEIINQARAY